MRLVRHIDEIDAGDSPYAAKSWDVNEGWEETDVDLHARDALVATRHLLMCLERVGAPECSAEVVVASVLVPRTAQPARSSVLTEDCAV